MRVCKGCGRYFAVTGYANAEYCNREFQNSGKTCKGVGAVRLVQNKLSTDPVHKADSIAKRRFGLDRIMAYLHDTALTEAALAVFCMNVHLKALLRAFRRFLLFPSECYAFLAA